MAFSHNISDIPDLDQRWNSLPGHGASQCVPAATVNLMYYYRGKGFGNAVK